MKKFLVLITALLALPVYGQIEMLHSEIQDTSPALRIVNAGTESIVFTVTSAGAASNMTLVVGSQTNTIDGSGTTDTITELAAAILACTNSSGTALSAANVTVDTDCSLGADSTDGELLNGTYTAAAGSTAEVLYDTSAAKFYQIYLPDNQASGAGHVKTGIIKSLKAYPGGTGDVTLDVYLGGTKVYQNVTESPVYISASNTASEVINLDMDLNIPRFAGQAAIVRISRATTATTGTIAVNVENPGRN